MQLGRACFNPRPREGGDFFINVVCNSVELVSIHAPAQGATLKIESFGVPFDVSIHAPAQGATMQPPCTLPDDDVSIHAPAQGATISPPSSRSSPSRFNPRPRAGGDPTTHLIGVLERWFQSTPPRRGRHHLTGEVIAYHLFQSTPPRRGRPRN